MSGMYLVLDLTNEGRSIRCLICGAISYNPNDVRERYCAFCHRFHDEMMSTMRPEDDASRTEGRFVSLLPPREGKQ